MLPPIRETQERGVSREHGDLYTVWKIVIVSELSVPAEARERSLSSVV